MGSEVAAVHVLMVSFPAQGHVNPLLRMAKLLASKGLLVTFTTTDHTAQMIKRSDSTTTGNNLPIPIGEGHLRFEFFSDGWVVDEPKRYNLDLLMHQLETYAKDSFTRLLHKQFEEGRPVSCLVGNPFVPWASDVATDMGIPCAVLWVQSCAVFSSYYHYFHRLTSFPTTDQPDLTVDLPGLPTLCSDEIPSFLHPTTRYVPLRNAILGQFKNLSKSFCVLVDSFEELERESMCGMEANSELRLRTVGPLFKHLSNEKKKINKDSIQANMWKAEENCIEWLDSQEPSSVVYVSFGSIVTLEKSQKEEMAWGLLKTGLPFLWVVRPAADGWVGDDQKLPEGFVEEAKGKGKVVGWCPQEQVLEHPSVACFVTHCGWNSSLESLSSGVPVVALPKWGDQVTNAKFLVDVYRVGVRMGRGEAEGKLVKRDEVASCILDVVRGPRAEEMKKNALKWKAAAKEAVAEGGSSDRNIQSFVDDVRGMTFLTKQKTQPCTNTIGNRDPLLPPAPIAVSAPNTSKVENTILPLPEVLLP
ncbi:gallate 1-beta-glucosyltransferase 84A23-like [Telopea speciosissima]|uniref:gallate 1-beta-glucosyltransferase 84A23-like n=1 Tax=Telopea speciosissima TaxID=54955 RepID=UPI001CC34D98|nr:gallate 1-beta-glucosyltransferase 84A23-like [Telopea speciosissima]